MNYIIRFIIIIWLLIVSSWTHLYDNSTRRRSSGCKSITFNYRKNCIPGQRISTSLNTSCCSKKLQNRITWEKANALNKINTTKKQWPISTINGKAFFRPKLTSSKGPLSNSKIRTNFWASKTLSFSLSQSGCRGRLMRETPRSLSWSLMDWRRKTKGWEKKFLRAITIVKDKLIRLKRMQKKGLNRRRKDRKFVIEHRSKISKKR